MRTIFVGHDSREVEAFDVACFSIKRRLSKQRTHVPVLKLSMAALQEIGQYRRPTECKSDGQLYDLLSADQRTKYDGRMSTEFAVARFFAMRYARSGLVAFVDCDVLARCDFNDVFDECEKQPGMAAWCVKHQYAPKMRVKMDGQPQHSYDRKNWSSVVVFDADHPANQALTLEVLNTWPGRDLHAFRWLPSDLIGSLPRTYNHLVGDFPHDPDAKVVHFTNGGPWFSECRDVPHAEAWLAERDEMLARRVSRAAKPEVAA